MIDVRVRRSFVFLTTILLLCIPACRRANDSNAESSLTILYDADERVFGPFGSSDPWFLLFLPLVTNDEHGQVVPRLAQSWEMSPDFRHWTFLLRSDVRWHDGVPTTAHDVKFTIEFQGRPDILYDDAWQDVDSIVVHDDTTLSIHYARPKDALNDWMVYWPKHILEKLDPAEFWEWEFWVRPVGNGPYRYVRHVPKTMVELEVNADFYAGKPAVERIRLKFGSSETGVVELLSGNVDILTRVNHADILGLVADPRFRLHHHLHPGVAWINTLAWNHRHPALSDARVRRALTKSLDRGELLEFLNLPPEFRVSDALFTPSQYLGGEVPAPIAFDPEGAHALLEEAGWSDSDGDDIVDCGGTPFQITVLVGSDEDEAVAVFAQAAFRRIGVDLQVSRLDESLVRNRVLAGEFEVAVYGFWNSTKGHTLWFGRTGETQYDSAQFPDIGYHNAEVVQLLSVAMGTFGTGQQNRIYEELAPIFLEDVPIFFLYPSVEAYVAHRRVRGFESPYRASPTRFLERFWIER